MGLFRRASVFLIRNKKRCMLFIFIIVFLSVSLILGINAINSMNSTIDKYKSNLAISFSVIKDSIPYADGSQFYTDSNNDGIPEYIGPMLCLKDAENILQIDERIQMYNAETNRELLTLDIDLCPALYTSFVKNVDDIEKENGEWTHEKYIEETRFNDEIASHTTWVHPVVESELHHLFYIGAFELNTGRHINKNDTYVALISQDLADINHLKIGDTFSTRQPIFYNATSEPYDRFGFFGDTVFLKIIGTFKINFNQEPSEWTAEDELYTNYILCDYKSYKKWVCDWRQFAQTYLNKGEDEFNVDEIRFFVSDPDDIDSIVSKVEQTDVLDWKFYHVEKNDEYESAVKPLNNISNMVMLFVLLISSGCIIVLFLLINMGEKTRKRETHIYRSLGISRRSIILQRVVEMVIVSVIAFITAIIIGSFLIVPFGEYISESINNNATEADEFEVSYDSNDNLIVEKNIQPDLSLKEEIGFEEIMITFAITEGAVLLATLIASKGKKDVLILE